MYKINWDSWRFIVLLDIFVYGENCIVLGIPGIGLTEYTDRGMLQV